MLVVEYYGVKQLMYGVLLFGLDIGCCVIVDMCVIYEVGFECGIYMWDYVYWQDNVCVCDCDWIVCEMQKSYVCFGEIFGVLFVMYGVVGWQMNDVVFEQIDVWGMCYVFDGCGYLLYLFVVGGCMLLYVQMLIMLFMFDEVFGIDGVDMYNVVVYIFKFIEINLYDQVFMLYVELEGQKFVFVFEQLFVGWCV